MKNKNHCKIPPQTHQDDYCQKQKYWRGCGETGTLVPFCTIGGNVKKWITMENSVVVPQKKKIKVNLPYNLTILLPGIYPKELK